MASGPVKKDQDDQIQEPVDPHGKRPGRPKQCEPTESIAAAAAAAASTHVLSPIAAAADGDADVSSPPPPSPAPPVDGGPARGLQPGRGGGCSSERPSSAAASAVPPLAPPVVDRVSGGPALEQDPWHGGCRWSEGSSPCSAAAGVVVRRGKNVAGIASPVPPPSTLSSSSSSDAIEDTDINKMENDMDMRLSSSSSSLEDMDATDIKKENLMDMRLSWDDFMMYERKKKSLWTSIDASRHQNETINLLKLIEQGVISSNLLSLHSDDQVCSSSEQSFGPIEDSSNGSPPPEYSWANVLGDVMIQKCPGTCLVAAVVCIEAQHRLEWERLHGAGTYPYLAASPRMLRKECQKDKIWTPENGADMNKVLVKIKERGGVSTTKAPQPAISLLPLRMWEVHKWNDGLTQELAVRLLHACGPCIGTLWVMAAYYLIDADQPGRDIVYDCWPREMRMIMEALYEDKSAGMHAVVCYAYRHTATGQLEILVRDNHTATGPRKWISFKEFDQLYVLRVDPLPLHNRHNGSLVYPRSCTTDT